MYNPPITTADGRGVSFRVGECMQKRWLLIVLLLLMAIGAAPRQVGRKISIASTKFTPDNLVLARNETVRWINDDDCDHALVDEAGTFSSGKLKPGQAFDFKFVKAGTYVYRCKLHPRERGKITVR